MLVLVLVQALGRNSCVFARPKFHLSPRSLLQLSLNRHLLGRPHHQSHNTIHLPDRGLHSKSLLALHILLD